jgi:D-glycero-beta-D-manno-heptose 1-phosphate adenylyltransferase
MNFREKLVPYSGLAEWRASLPANRRPLVVTNGCFDLLHAGHVTYLENARNEGASLLIGVNDDASVRGLKGENRPINPEGDRALVLAALESVSAVCIFPGVRATDFLTLAAPDIYVKGGDYTVDTLDANERAAVQRVGGRIVIIPFLPGRSTTATIQRMQ